MATPSLFPTFMKAQSGGGGGGPTTVVIVQDFEIMPMVDMEIVETVIDLEFLTTVVDLEVVEPIELEVE